MVLANENLFGSLAEFFGVPSSVIEGGTVGVLAFAVLGLVAIVLKFLRQDDKQMIMGGELIKFAGTLLEEVKHMREAYQKNTDVLDGLKSAFDKFVSSLEDVGDTVDEKLVPVNKTMEQIEKNLIRNAKTKVVIRDKAGKVLAKVVVTPASDEDGTAYLSVTYELIDAQVEVESDDKQSEE